MVDEITSFSRYRGNWKVRVDQALDGRVKGEVISPETHAGRTFDVKRQDGGKFSLSVGSSGTKVFFLLP